MNNDPLNELNFLQEFSSLGAVGSDETQPENQTKTKAGDDQGAEKETVEYWEDEAEMRQHLVALEEIHSTKEPIEYIPLESDQHGLDDSTVDNSKIYLLITTSVNGLGTAIQEFQALQQ